MASPTTLAAIDVGTNSFHLVVARVRAGGRFEIITREKSMVRLGHGGGDMKHLEPDAIERGVTTLRHMRQIAQASGAQVRAVATSAVREADNAGEFLHRAATEAGVVVEVVSGLEEARLIHLGVLQAVPAYDRRLLLVDIGGGSTEILIGERGRTLTARSFKLGAVRLTDRFFPGGRSAPKAVAACRSFIRSVLAGFEREVETIGFELAVASSGTAEAVARMVHAASGGEPLRTYNCFEFNAAQVSQVAAAASELRTPRARGSVPGLDVERADIIVAGSILLDEVCRAFGVQTLWFSDYALREGVLLDTIERQRGGSVRQLRDVARASVRHLAERCDDDLAHSTHVARLALQLFDATTEWHGLEPNWREYLEAAAVLANVGLVISHSKHHLHSYYVIRNSDDLTGFTDAEIELIALVARYHRKSAPKPTHAEFSALPPESQRAVTTLAAILRIAIGLDRSHDQRVRSLVVHGQGRRLILEAVPRRRRDDLSLELYSAKERAGLFEALSGLTVDVVTAA